MSSVYIPGATSPAASPAVVAAPAATAPASGLPDSVASDLADLRKLAVTALWFRAGMLVFAAITAASTGFMAYILFRFLAGMAEAFESSGV